MTQLWKVGSLLNKTKLYSDDFHIVGMLTISVFSKANNCFKCGVSIKIKPLKYLGNLKIQLVQTKHDETTFMLQKKEYSLAESDKEVTFNAALDLKTVKDSATLDIRYFFKGEEATNFRMLSNRTILPISMLKFVKAVSQVSSTSFGYLWRRHVGEGQCMLLKTRPLKMDLGMFRSAHDLQYLFETMVILAPEAGESESCGLIYEDGNRMLVTMVKIRIHQNQTFDLQLLFKDDQEKAASEIGNYLIKCLTL